MAVLGHIIYELACLVRLPRSMRLFGTSWTWPLNWSSMALHDPKQGVDLAW